MCVKRKTPSASRVAEISITLQLLHLAGPNPPVSHAGSTFG